MKIQTVAEGYTPPSGAPLSAAPVLSFIDAIFPKAKTEAHWRWASRYKDILIPHLLEITLSKNPKLCLFFDFHPGVLWVSLLVRDQRCDIFELPEHDKDALVGWFSLVAGDCENCLAEGKA